MNEYLSLTSSVLLVPRRPGLSAGEDNVVEILLRVQAPDSPPAGAAARPPQAMALVIDRSGSMAGTPLIEAQRCAAYVASRLRASDLASVVQFDHRVRLLLPALPVGDGDAVRQAVAGIVAGGNTNLHGGWLAGAESLLDAPHASLRRVILLSDGCANSGVTDEAEIRAAVARMAAQGITTSTYGLGRNFNEELMVWMARAGGGSSYYGDAAEDLHEPFQREFDLLTNLCLVRPVFSCQAPDAVQVQCPNDLPADEGGWRLPDVAWGAEAWAMLRLTVPRTAVPPAGERLALLAVEVSGQSLEGDAVRLARASLSLPVLSAQVLDAMPQNELVLRRLAELEAAKLMARLRLAAAQERWDEVDDVLDEAQRAFGGYDWLAGMLDAMAELARGRDRLRMMKEAMYSSDKLRSRLAAKQEALSRAQESAGPSFLRRKDRQGKDET